MRLIPLLVLLSGCWYVGDERYAERVQDADGDGGIAERFGGPDCVDDDPTVADCDADADGFRAAAAGGDDCDDADAAVLPVPWYADADGDGAGAGPQTTGCGAVPAGFSTNDDDCAPDDPSVAPGLPERCDAVDRDCDGDPAAGAVDATLSLWTDADLDGYGGQPAPGRYCAITPGLAPVGGDCADADPAVNPGAVEVPYDGRDQDCGGGDDDDADADGHVDLGHGGDDCDDADPDVWPGAPEVCDGVDNDCDADVDTEDDGLTGLVISWYADADADGYPGGAPVPLCPGVFPGPTYGLVAEDCDDDAADVHPGADERCNDADDDCDGVTDEPDALDAFTAWLDVDGDGWGGLAVLTCDGALDADGDGALDPLAARGGDCDDLLADAHPGADEVCGDGVRQDCRDLDPDDCDGDGALAHDPAAPDCNDDPAADGALAAPGLAEVCDGVDNDCDGLSDESGALRQWWKDADADGYGVQVKVGAPTCVPPAGAATNTDDCDDTRAGVYPGAPELCDGIDDDCDLAIDEEPVDGQTWWLDADGDGAGAGAPSLPLCDAPLDHVGRGDDCDDTDPTNGPLLDEQCDDGDDNDCDGLVDDDDPDALLADGGWWWLDLDGDGLGAGVAVLSCGDPTDGVLEYVGNGLDCDDADAAIGDGRLWYPDDDGDGYAGDTAVFLGCTPPDAGVWTTLAEDCDDADAAVHPDADDVCDGRDNDCDRELDEDPGADPNAWTLWPDADADGQGDLDGTAIVSCFIEAGWSPLPLDCDDTRADVWAGYPAEVCGDGADNDCDTLLDADDPDAPPAWTDADGDGWGELPATPCDPDTAPRPGDCADSDAGANPDMEEVCGDGIDQDCDGADCGLCRWAWVDADRDGWGDRDVLPTWTCDALLPGQVTTPGDCDDGDKLALPDLSGVGNSADLLTAMSDTGCRIVALSPGTYKLAGVLGAATNPSLTLVAADPDDRPLLTRDGVAPIFTVGADAGAPLLYQLDLDGGTTPAETVSMSGGALTLADVALTASGAAGIKQLGGGLTLRGLTISGTAGTVEGTALRVTGGGLDAEGLTISGSAARAAVYASVPIALRDVTVRGGGGLRFETETINGLTLSDVALLDNLGDALVVVTPLSGVLGGTTAFDHLLIASPGDDGLVFDATSVKMNYPTLTIDQITVVDAPGRGIHVAGYAPSVTVRRALLVDDATAATFSSISGGFDLVDSLFSLPVSGVTIVGRVNGSPDGAFVTYSADVLATDWDLHLRDGSVPWAAGLGAYPPSDPWYLDADLDGVPDGWVYQYFSLVPSVISDVDQDGMPDLDEYALGSLPLVADTDGDAVLDGDDTFPLDGLKP